MKSFKYDSRNELFARIRHAWTATPKADTIRKFWTRGHLIPSACMCLLSALAGCLFAGIVGYISYVKPLEQSLGRAEAAALARNLDGAVKARSAALRMAIGSLEQGQAIDSAALERVMRGFSRAFPDLLSLEIADEQKEMIAMMGDLPLSEAARPIMAEAAREQAAAVIDAFGDDPTRNSFFIAQEEQAPGGERWFARARFTRGSINEALAAVPNASVASLIAAPEKTRVRDWGLTEMMTGLGNGFARPTAAEEFLAAPGWVVRLERQTGSAFSFWFAAVFGLMVVLAMVLYLIPRSRPWLNWQAATDDLPEKTAQPVPNIESMSAEHVKPELKRQSEIIQTGVMPSSVESQAAYDSSEVQDGQLQAGAAAYSNNPSNVLAAGMHSGEIPELLEITWDEIHIDDDSINEDSKTPLFPIP